MTVIKQSFWLLGCLSLLNFSCQKSSNSPDLTTTSNLSVADLTNVSLSAAQISSGFEFNISGSSNQGSAVNINNGIGYESFAFNTPQTRVPFSDDRGTNSGNYYNKFKSRSFALDGNSLLIPNDTFAALYMFENLDERLTGFNFDFFGLAKPSIRSYLRGVAINKYIPFLKPGFGNSFGFKADGKPGGLYNWFLLDTILNQLDSVVFDFGAGKTYITKYGDTLFRSGTVTILRTSEASSNTISKTIKFNNFNINGYVINGNRVISRARNYNLVDSVASLALTSTASGTITLPNGNVFNISSTRNKSFNFIVRRIFTRYIFVALKGNVTTTVNTQVTRNGGTFFSYITSSPIIEDFSCISRVKPKSGTIDINYLTDVIKVEFSGDCGSRTISLTINGVTTTKTITNAADNDDDDHDD